jgi:hypothetical protein
MQLVISDFGVPKSVKLLFAGAFVYIIAMFLSLIALKRRLCLQARTLVKPYQELEVESGVIGADPIDTDKRLLT